MTYRLAGRAEDVIDGILPDSARRWGVATAAKYHRLILAAFTAIGESPVRPGARDIPRVAGLHAHHLRSARSLVDKEHRIADPRHLVIYRVALDGIVEILSLAHDHQQLPRAARRAQREADS